MKPLEKQNLNEVIEKLPLNEVQKMDPSLWLMLSVSGPRVCELEKSSWISQPDDDLYPKGLLVPGTSIQPLNRPDDFKLSIFEMRPSELKLDNPDSIYYPSMNSLFQLFEKKGEELHFNEETINRTLEHSSSLDLSDGIEVDCSHSKTIEDEGYISPSPSTLENDTSNKLPTRICDWKDLMSELPTQMSTWERLGGSKVKEKPYSSEAGEWILDAGDLLWTVRRSVASGNNCVSVPRNVFCRDAKLLLLGVCSQTFIWEQRGQKFILPLGTHLCTLSPLATVHLCQDLLVCGSAVRHLQAYTTRNTNSGLCQSALQYKIGQYLQLHRIKVMHLLPSTESMSLVSMSRLAESQRSRMEALMWLGGAEEKKEKILPLLGKHGGMLLGKFMPLINASLLQGLCTPFFRCLGKWIFEGQLEGSREELCVSLNARALSYKDKTMWKRGFETLAPLPSFIEGLQDMLLQCGKAIYVLRMIDPQNHFLSLLTREHPPLVVPRGPAHLVSLQEDFDVFSKKIHFAMGWEIPWDPERIRHDNEALAIIHAKAFMESSRLGFQRERALIKEAKYLQKQSLMRDIQEHLSLNKQWREQKKQDERREDEYYVLEAQKKEQEMVEWETQKRVKNILYYQELLAEIEKKESLQNKTRNLRITGIEEILSAVPSTDGTDGTPTMDATFEDDTKETLSYAPNVITDTSVKEISTEEILGKSCVTPENVPVIVDLIASAGKSEEGSDVVINGVTFHTETVEAVVSLSSVEVESGNTRMDVSENDSTSEHKCDSDLAVIPYDTTKLNFDGKLMVQLGADIIPGINKIGKKIETEEWDISSGILFQVFLHKTLLTPLHIQTKLANKCLALHMLRDLHLLGHLQALQAFLLLQNGPFAHSLTRDLFTETMTISEKTHYIHPPMLKLILDDAIAAANPPLSDFSPNLYLQFREENSTTPSIPFMGLDLVDKMELRYELKWPLTLIVSEEDLDHYAQLFCILLRAACFPWLLNQVYYHIRTAARHQHKHPCPEFSKAQFLWHRLQHVAQSLCCYLGTSLMQLQAVLLQQLPTLNSVDDIRKAHTRFLRTLRHRCLVLGHTEPLLRSLRRPLVLAQDLYRTSCTNEWQIAFSPPEDEGGVADQIAARKKISDKLDQMKSVVDKALPFLFDVTWKLGMYNSHTFLHDFLVVLDFSHYYQQQMELRNILL